MSTKPKIQKVMVQPINLIFRYLQNRSRIQVWLSENTKLRIEGLLIGFDEYMNLVLEDACEYYLKTNIKKPIGRILLKVQSKLGTAPIDSENKTFHANGKATEKKNVVIATMELAPFMMKRQVPEANGTYEWYGYCVDFFNELVKHLPYELTYKVYQVKDNRFGSKSKRNSFDQKNNRTKQQKFERWNGLIGDLYDGKADLALAPLAVMAERELAIDFTVPFYDLVGIQILLKKPEVPQDWFKFLTVLDGEVWFSITIAYFVTSFVMFLFDRLSPYSHKNLSRIKKLRKNAKVGSASSEKSPVTQLNDKITTFSPSSNADSKKNNLLSTESLVKNHEPIVPLSNRLPYQKPLFFLSGTDPPTQEHKASKIPSISSEKLNQLKRRPSRAINDYFQGVQFRKSIGAWDFDDTEESENDDGKPDFGLRDSFWFCITSLTPQGGGEAPQNLSGRIVAGAWWLFCFIIIASYTANLAAFLTVSRLDIPIDSLDDLAKQFRIKYAPVDGSAEQTYFERMAYIEEIFYNIWKDMSLNESLSEEERSKFAVWDYPISDKYTKIWAQIQQTGMPTDTDAGIKRVKSSSIDDGFALLADANLVKHAVMTDCNFKAVGEEFSRKPIALGIRKGQDQFRDDLSYAILQLINQRFMEILREKWWTNNPNRVICDNNDESEGIRLENIVGVFIIIFAGVFLSFLVWAIEKFVYRTKIGVSQDIIQRL